VSRGYGVRALERVQRGAFVLEYAGEVIDEAELAARMEAAKAAGEPCYYVMDLGRGLYVDARMRGSMGGCFDPQRNHQTHRRKLHRKCDVPDVFVARMCITPQKRQ
jgi:hypothetical protein